MAAAPSVVRPAAGTVETCPRALAAGRGEPWVLVTRRAVSSGLATRRPALWARFPQEPIANASTAAAAKIDALRNPGRTQRQALSAQASHRHPAENRDLNPPHLARSIIAAPVAATMPARAARHIG
jgi:hypothetical protein